MADETVCCLTKITGSFTSKEFIQRYFLRILTTSLMELFYRTLWWAINLMSNYQFEIESKFEIEFEIEIELEFESEFKVDLTLKLNLNLNLSLNLSSKLQLKLYFHFFFKVAL